MSIKNLYISVLFLFSFHMLNAQCYPDRHSTTWFDGWVSCQTSTNPNSAYGSSHWIMYDLGYDYTLNESKFWNANEPNNLDYGISTYTVDHSLDGITWTNLGTFTMNQASGLSTYEGGEGPDFDGVKARFVLITPTSNYGGDCFGMSEMRIAITDPFEVIDEEDGFNALVYPNPFIDNVSLRIATLNDEAPLTYALYDILGRNIMSSSITLQPDVDTYELTLNGKALSFGVYILNIEQGSDKKSFKLIKRE